MLVIVSDLEDPMEIIDNGRYGYSFQSENSKELADKILANGANCSEQVPKSVEALIFLALRFCSEESILLMDSCYLKGFSCRYTFITGDPDDFSIILLFRLAIFR